MSDSLAECSGAGKAATNPLDFILFQVLFLEGVKRLLWTERKRERGGGGGKVSYAGTGHGVK